jgi:hypothetical protein
LQGATNPILSINSNGDTSFRNQTNSTTAFNIQNAAGTAFVTADSSNQQLIVRNKTDSATIGSDIFGADNNTCSGTNWTDTGTNVWTHTAGSASYLVCSSPSITANTTYEITYSTSGTVSGEYYLPYIGGVVGGRI